MAVVQKCRARLVHRAQLECIHKNCTLQLRQIPARLLAHLAFRIGMSWRAAGVARLKWCPALGARVRMLEVAQLEKEIDSRSVSPIRDKPSGSANVWRNIREEADSDD